MGLVLFVGANIFLTSSGCLKLGDFGCSEKLKSHATLPGEFNSLVGTMGNSKASIFKCILFNNYCGFISIWASIFVYFSHNIENLDKLMDSSSTNTKINVVILTLMNI